MSAAPVLMRAYPGGHASPTSPLTVTKAPRALHIDPRILAQPGLSLTACALLAEVLDLYQVSGRVFANDAHFAARCRCSERTVRNTIAELQESGYLAREVDHKRADKRLLVPTEKWQILPEVVAESAGSSGESCQDFRQNLPRVPANSANINTTLNTSGNTTLKNTPPSADAAAARPEKKREELPAELPADDEQLVPPVARPPRSKPAKPGDPEHFAAFWQAWPKKEKRQDAVAAFAKLSSDDQAAAASRADTWLAARPDLADPTRYRFIPHATTWLNQARWTDQAAPLVISAHVNPTATAPFQRPANGAKPSGPEAAELAAALFEQLAE